MENSVGLFHWIDTGIFCRLLAVTLLRLVAQPGQRPEPHAVKVRIEVHLHERRRRGFTDVIIVRRRRGLRESIGREVAIGRAIALLRPPGCVAAIALARLKV